MLSLGRRQVVLRGRPRRQAGRPTLTRCVSAHSTEMSVVVVRSTVRMACAFRLVNDTSSTHVEQRVRNSFSLVGTLPKHTQERGAVVLGFTSNPANLMSAGVGSGGNGTATWRWEQDPQGGRCVC